MYIILIHGRKLSNMMGVYRSSFTNFNHRQEYLNQAHAWFLRILSVCKCLYLCMCVCVSAPRLLITIGVIWRDIVFI